MVDGLKIIIIGDYNFSYNSHHATNLAFDHASNFLDIEISYYWVKLSEVIHFKPQHFDQYDGIFVAPGPIKNQFYLNAILNEISTKKTPTLITGIGYKVFLEVLIQKYRLNTKNEKLISDNLASEQSFEKIQITPSTESFIKLYSTYSNIELTTNRFSMYPQLIHNLTQEIIDIDAYNQFEEPEIYSLKNHDFFVACGFYPQISSTRELPHPIIYTFIKMCKIALEKKSA